MTTLKTFVYAAGLAGALALAGTPAVSHARPAAVTEHASVPFVPEAQQLEARERASTGLEDFRGGERTYVITGTTILIALLIVVILILVF